MEVNLHGDGIKINESLEKYTRARVDKLDRYLPNIGKVWVELSIIRTARSADIATAQITLQHARGAILRAEERMPIESRDTIRHALNKSLDKMHRQIDRFKSKRRSKNQRVRERYRATVAELDLAEEVPAYFRPPQAETAQEDIVRRKQVALVSMNEEEAIEQLEYLSHQFYWFMNEETAEMNLLYRRENGGYGLLVPSASS